MKIKKRDIIITMIGILTGAILLFAFSLLESQTAIAEQHSIYDF